MPPPLDSVAPTHPYLWMSAERVKSDPLVTCLPTVSSVPKKSERRCDLLRLETGLLQRIWPGRVSLHSLQQYPNACADHGENSIDVCLRSAWWLGSRFASISVGNCQNQVNAAVYHSARYEVHITDMAHTGGEIVLVIKGKAKVKEEHFSRLSHLHVASLRKRCAMFLTNLGDHIFR